jgi:O-methyltransferase domain
VLHDWDDARAIRLLTNCHHAMQGQGKLLVIESIISPNNAPSSVLFGDLTVFLL